MYALGNELGRRTTVDEVFDQLHAEIYDLLKKRDEAGTIRLIRHHLTRLDKTLDAARQSHGEYFED